MSSNLGLKIHISRDNFPLGCGVHPILISSGFRSRNKLIADLFSRWIETIENIEANVINVTGDILISSGCVAYMTPFTDQYRRNLFTQWIRLIEVNAPQHSKLFFYKKLPGTWNTIFEKRQSCKRSWRSSGDSLVATGWFAQRLSFDGKCSFGVLLEKVALICWSARASEQMGEKYGGNRSKSKAGFHQKQPTCRLTKLILWLTRLVRITSFSKTQF